jgi:acyl-CoA reductase-like NAD-dependent aldehyde dehydrogenase
LLRSRRSRRSHLQVHYQPLGTTLALVSWNYSFHNLLSPLLASLFAGNSCVIKCSEQVAWSSAWFFGGVRTCLEACGHDPEVIQLVICLPEVAETVTRNPLVKHITCERGDSSSALSPIFGGTLSV